MSDNHPTWYSRCETCGALFIFEAGKPPVGECDMEAHQRAWDKEDRERADPLGLTLEEYRALRAQGEVA